jgi:hypothetical protein
VTSSIQEGLPASGGLCCVLRLIMGRWMPAEADTSVAKNITGAVRRA